jgi:hypothetical protein
VGSRCSGEGRTGLRHPVCRWLQYGYSLLGIWLWSVVFGWALFIICRRCSIYDISRTPADLQDGSGLDADAFLMKGSEAPTGGHTAAIRPRKSRFPLP